MFKNAESKVEGMVESITKQPAKIWNRFSKATLFQKILIGFSIYYIYGKLFTDTDTSETEK